MPSGWISLSLPPGSAWQSVTTPSSDAKPGVKSLAKGTKYFSSRASEQRSRESRLVRNRDGKLQDILGEKFGFVGGQERLVLSRGLRN